MGDRDKRCQVIGIKPGNSKVQYNNDISAPENGSTQLNGFAKTTTIQVGQKESQSLSTALVYRSNGEKTKLHKPTLAPKPKFLALRSKSFKCNNDSNSNTDIQSQKKQENDKNNEELNGYFYIENRSVNVEINNKAEQHTQVLSSLSVNTREELYKKNEQFCSKNTVITDNNLSEQIVDLYRTQLPRTLQEKSQTYASVGDNKNLECTKEGNYISDFKEGKINRTEKEKIFNEERLTINQSTNKSNAFKYVNSLIFNGSGDKIENNTVNAKKKPTQQVKEITKDLSSVPQQNIKVITTMASEESNDFIEPVSDIRKRFEKMNIKFRKPSDNETMTSVSSPNIESPIIRSTNNPAAEFFKDIWEMRSEDLEDPFNKSLDESAYSKPLDDDKKTSIINFMKNDPVKEKKQNVGDLREKFEVEFESKVINSLVCPTERQKLNKDILRQKPYTIAPDGSITTRKIQSLPRKFTTESIDRNFYLETVTPKCLPMAPNPLPTPNTLQNNLFIANEPDQSKDDVSDVYVENNKKVYYLSTINNVDTKKSITTQKLPLIVENNASKISNKNPGNVNKQNGFSYVSESVDQKKCYRQNDQQSVTGECSLGTPQASLRMRSHDTDFPQQEVMYYDNMLAVSNIHNQPRNVASAPAEAALDKNCSESFAIDNELSKSEDSKTEKLRNFHQKEFDSALNDLEKEFMKLSDTINVTNSDTSNEEAPPKLPPKKRKSANNVINNNNNQVIIKESGLSTCTMSTETTLLSESSKQEQLLRLQQQQALLQKLQTKQRELMQQNLQQHQLNQIQEESPRSIVDEPLSTIEEEESNYVDSCRSSLIMEENDKFESCVSSSQSTLNASSETDPDQPLLSEEETEVDIETLASESSYSENTIKPPDFRKSYIDEVEFSDVESIEWTESPMQNNRIPRSVSDKAGYDRDVAELTGVGKPLDQIIKPSQNIHSENNTTNSVLTLKTKMSEVSCENGDYEDISENEVITTPLQAVNYNQNIFGNEISAEQLEYPDDVSPYGVFDLSQLENPHPDTKRAIMSELGIDRFEPSIQPFSEPPNYAPKMPDIPMGKTEEVQLPRYDNLEKYNINTSKPPRHRKQVVGKHSTAVSALDRHEALRSRKQSTEAKLSQSSTVKNKTTYSLQTNDSPPKSQSEENVQSRALPQKPQTLSKTNLLQNTTGIVQSKYTDINKVYKWKDKNSSTAEKENEDKKRLSNQYEELVQFNKKLNIKCLDDKPNSPEKTFTNENLEEKSEEAKAKVQEILNNILPPDQNFQSNNSNVNNFPVENEDLPKNVHKFEIMENTCKPKLSKPFNSQISSVTSNSNSSPLTPSKQSLGSRRQHDAYFSVGDDEDNLDSVNSRRSQCSRAYDGDTDGAVEFSRSECETLRKLDYSSDDTSSSFQTNSLYDISNETKLEKVISPSLRKKRSLLQRSKSPSQSISRRSKSPAVFNSRDRDDDSVSVSETTKKESRVKKFRRSFRRRSIKSGEESGIETAASEVESPPPIPSRIAMRRSKSQDRYTAAEEYKKMKKASRSKSLERPREGGFNTDDGAVSSGSKRSSGFFRGSKRFSRRGRSVERKNVDGDEKRSHSRGRNPVSFIRKLLRKSKGVGEEDPRIVKLPNSPTDNKKAEEPLTTIMAYKSTRKQAQRERRKWTPPRTSTDQNNKSRTTQKPMRSPPSHRAKKLQRNKHNNDNGSSSETGTIDRLRISNDPYENLGDNRLGLCAPPPRIRNREDSFSNSAQSSDSEINRNRRKRFSDTDGTSDCSFDGNQGKPTLGKTKKQSIRTKPLRVYDSESTTSAAVSEHENSSPLLGSDSKLRSALKKGATLERMRGNNRAPRRPVRLVPPSISKSDPSIFCVADDGSHYYNVENNEVQQRTRPKSWGRKHKEAQRRNIPQTNCGLESHQRHKYKTLVSLNAQTLRKVAEKWLSEWRNQLPVGGFLITSWPDVTLTSKKPLCMIGNSVIFSAHFTTNPDHKVSCQLYDQAHVSSRFLRQLENCSTLTANPNVCGVCSHFQCRVPRHLIDPNTGSGVTDALCVVLYSRPVVALTDYLNQIVGRSDDITELYRQLLLVLIQLLQGLEHLAASGFAISNITLEHLIVTQQRGLMQILPHLDWRDDNQNSDTSVDYLPTRQNPSSTALQVARLMRRIMKSPMYTNTRNIQKSSRYTNGKKIIPGTQFSTALQAILKYLERPDSKMENNFVVSLAQCALWGPRELDDVESDDVSPFHALEMWIDMEQAKLVNSLAVLPSGKTEPMKPSTFLRHQYFSQVNPESLFSCLKVLERI